MNIYKIGLDIGSTTIKITVLDSNNHLIYSEYTRHMTDIKNTLLKVIARCQESLGNITCRLVITGSGGLSVSNWLNLPFEQEVIACQKAVETYLPTAEVVIELGGEDAKITYLGTASGKTIEQRMNNSCAGGTGSFIDQMASLIHTDAIGLNELAQNYKMLYQVASRCGVFAKTDIQPLLNDGARREDIAASIFQAVVNQTIGGLACGKPIKGKVAFLGGPLYFLSQLRIRFMETLNLKEEDALIPQNGLLYPALGAALLASEVRNENTKEDVYKPKSIPTNLTAIMKELNNLSDKNKESHHLKPLFSSMDEFTAFQKRHDKEKIKRIPLKEYKGDAFLGVDAGSTTIKAVLISERGELLYQYYGNNEGDPLKKNDIHFKGNL